METRRWLNQSQPQTLYMATILLYITAALLILFGGAFSLLGLILVAASAGGGFGIANEQRWGYGLALAFAGFRVALLLWFVARDPDLLFNLLFLIDAVFPVALFLLLIHPQSRDYQRIWFS